MLPIIFLIVMIGFCAEAWLWHAVSRQRMARVLRRLGEQWKMRYSQEDPFGLSPRVSRRLPTPGASDVRVMDLLYRAQEERREYLFTVEYTLGVVRSKHRVRQAASFSEPKDASDAVCEKMSSPLILAQENLPLLEQYKQLAQQLQENEEVEAKEPGFPPFP